MPNKYNSVIKDIVIAGESILPGDEKQIDVQISKLPTRTNIEIPVIVSRSDIDGPCLLLMGGVHGDEINGVEIIRRVISHGHNKPKIGTVICVPIVNVYGFISFSRKLPDGKDLNRSFPGSKTGSLGSQIAYHIRTGILPIIDYGIDFHTGGSRINNFPQIRTVTSNPKNLSMAKAFSTKFIVNSPALDHSLRKEAAKQDKPFILYEGGESMRLRKNAVDEGVNGIIRVMKHLGMTDSAPKSTYDTILINNTSWLRSTAAGMFHLYKRSGEKVEPGEIIGLITGPLGEFERPIKSKRSGYIISVNNTAVVNRGDALVHIGLL